MSWWLAYLPSVSATLLPFLAYIDYLSKLRCDMYMYCVVTRRYRGDCNIGLAVSCSVNRQHVDITAILDTSL